MTYLFCDFNDRHQSDGTFYCLYGSLGDIVFSHGLFPSVGEEVVIGDSEIQCTGVVERVGDDSSDGATAVYVRPYNDFRDRETSMLARTGSGHPFVW